MQWNSAYKFIRYILLCVCETSKRLNIRKVSDTFNFGCIQVDFWSWSTCIHQTFTIHPQPEIQTETKQSEENTLCSGQTDCTCTFSLSTPHEAEGRWNTFNCMRHKHPDMPNFFPAPSPQTWFHCHHNIVPEVFISSPHGASTEQAVHGEMLQGMFFSAPLPPPPSGPPFKWSASFRDFNCRPDGSSSPAPFSHSPSASPSLPHGGSGCLQPA